MAVFLFCDFILPYITKFFNIFHKKIIFWIILSFLSVLYNKKVKSYIYKHCPNGFYVYAKPTLTNNQDVLKYIGRYLGRPVIFTSRIDNYDGELKNSITFSRFCTTSFCYALFDLISIISYFFKKRTFLYRNQKSVQKTENICRKQEKENER